MELDARCEIMLLPLLNGTGEVAAETLPVGKEEEINKTRIEVTKRVLIQLITLNGMVRRGCGKIKIKTK